MTRRLALFLAFVCAIVLQVSATQVVAQDSPQTVRAAIPPQPPAPAPVPAAVPTQARPPVASAPRAEPVPVVPPTPRPQFDAEAANVRLDVTISYQVGTSAPVKRTASLTVADAGAGSLRAGNQVAVPSTTFQPAQAPMTSFSYRSVGLNVDARSLYVQGNRAKVNLNVEFSAVDEKTSDAAGRPPSFPTFSQNLTLILENGKPLVVAQTSDYVDNIERKQSVEVKATILR